MASPADDPSSKIDLPQSPESRLQEIQWELLKLTEKGFTPAEISAAALSMPEDASSAEAPSGQQSPGFPQIVRGPSSSPESADITEVSAQLQGAVAAASPALAAALDQAAALPAPEAFPSSLTPAESAEAPLESDPFSKAAILRINDVYQIADPQGLAEYLDDEEYVTYKHTLEQRAKEFKPERVPLAQQFVCSLPTLPEAKRKHYVDAWSYYLTSDDLRPSQHGTPLSPEHIADTGAEDKLSFLRTGKIPTSWTSPPTRNEPLFDFTHKLDLLTRDSLDHLLSYAMVRLFRKGLLADFKFGNPPVTGDQAFANVLRVDNKGYLNMVGLNGQGVVVSAQINGSWHSEKLTPEIKALLFAETRAIYQEMLPSINCLKGIENKCGSVKMWNALNLMRDNVEVSGLREDPQGRMVCNTTAKTATSTTKGVTVIGKLWHGKGTEEGEKLRQIGILKSKIFGGRDHLVPGARYHNVNTGHHDLNRLDAILAGTVPESEGHPPATLTLLSLLQNAITSYAPKLLPPTRAIEWSNAEDTIGNSQQYLSLSGAIARIQKLKGDLADESKWRKPTGLLNIGRKAPDRAPVEKELQDKRVELNKLLGSFYHYMSTESPLTKFLLHQQGRLILPQITEESDVSTLIEALIRSVKETYEVPNSKSIATLRKYIAAHKQLIAELQAARDAGVEIFGNIMDGLSLSSLSRSLSPELKKALGLE